MESEPITPSLPTVSWEMIEKSLAHPNVLIRQKAIELAGRFNDARAVAALQTLVRDEHPVIRSSAAQALVHAARQRNFETESALAQLITSAADDELRVFLISNVSAGGGDILLRAVIAALVDPAANIRHAAEVALKKQGGSWLITEAAAEMLPTIEGARSAFNAEVSAAATRWATQLQRAQLRRTMLNSGLATALTLTRALQSANPLMREAAAEALWQSNDPRALPALRDTLRDAEESVRRTAALALGTVGWQPTTLDELISWEVVIGRWDSAVAHGEAALDALLFAAQHSSPGSQAKAIECVAELRSLRAMLQLVPMLRSEHAVVRRATAKALKSLEWMPVNAGQAIALAIELEDWPEVSSFGADAIPALTQALKASHNQPERHAMIHSSLLAITDPCAADELVPLCRDGEVAATAVAALINAFGRNPSDVSDEALSGILGLKNVAHFKFEIDPVDGTPVRSGIELIDLTVLRRYAEAELARREKSPAVVAVATTEAEAA
jgi:HEAT repeat protein